MFLPDKECTHSRIKYRKRGASNDSVDQLDFCTAQLMVTLKGQEIPQIIVDTGVGTPVK